MDNSEQQFQKDGKKISLLKSEKEHMLNQILAMPSELPKKELSLSFFGLLTNAKIAVSAAFILLLLISVPVTYAAQKSGPGDLLHGLELSVIEPLEHFALFSSDSQIAYSTNRLEERLDELQAVPKDQINEEQIAIASENIQGYANEALIVNPESPKKEVISHFVKVSALLNAHEDVMAEDGQDEPTIAAIVDQAEDQLTDQVEEYAEDQAPGELAKTVQEEVQQTTELLADQIQDPEIIAISKQLEEAKKDISQGDYEEALQEILDAKVQALAQTYADPSDEEIQP